MNKLTLATCLMLLIGMAPATPARAQQPAGHQEEAGHAPGEAHTEAGAHTEEDEHTEEEEHQGHIELAASLAKTLGISTQQAGPGEIERHLRVYGRLVIPPDQQVRVSARFPGLITSVAVELGERVDKGQRLARIESNRSLQTYALTSPIAGRVIQRQANVGEASGQAPLFVVANTHSLWAQLKIFPDQMARVQPGQRLHLDLGDKVYTGKIEQLLPVAAGRPFRLARLSLPNGQRQHSPGELVTADIDVASSRVALRVDNRALQQMEGETVVFVRTDDGYAKRAIQIGIGDGRFTQVLDGLAAGETYVVGNSYLLKAELMKASATHSH